jgi:hypothetical protein
MPQSSYNLFIPDLEKILLNFPPEYHESESTFILHPNPNKYSKILPNVTHKLMAAEQKCV